MFLQIWLQHRSKYVCYIFFIMQEQNKVIGNGGGEMIKIGKHMKNKQAELWQDTQ